MFSRSASSPSTENKEAGPPAWETNPAFVFSAYQFANPVNPNSMR
jgi:hypothetical protein